MSKKQKSMVIELPQEQANAIMLMLESEMEKTFEPRSVHNGGIDPIADWETVHYHAYQLLAYQAFKEKYLETYDA